MANPWNSHKTLTFYLRSFTSTGIDRKNPKILCEPVAPWGKGLPGEELT
jgi:hypothetical protein